MTPAGAVAGSRPSAEAPRDPLDPCRPNAPRNRRTTHKFPLSAVFHITLDWLRDPELRRRATAILNKGELRNDLARAVCLNRLGEIRDRTFEAQRHRASGLNLVTAAIILWNTVYLNRAISALRDQGRPLEDAGLQHISPVCWNHINRIGNYSWRQNKRVEERGLRPLRMPRGLNVLYFPFRQATSSRTTWVAA